MVITSFGKRTKSVNEYYSEETPYHESSGSQIQFLPRSLNHHRLIALRSLEVGDLSGIQGTEVF